ncbi:MAG TPA: DUF5317 domain-containing protein [Firmicutes bacterium]|nr:DUF5317 domain-containing protein [Bacillota bacterium]
MVAMLIDAAIISLVVGLLRKGSLQNLGNLTVRQIPLILIACLLQGGSLFLAQRGVDFFVRFGSWLNLFSFGLLLIALWANRHERAFVVIGLGVLLNGIVICANGGRMPVSIDSLEAVGLGELGALLETGDYITHTKLTDASVLTFLADWLYIPGYKRARVFSIGDVIISLGVFWLIQRAMVQKRVQPKEGFFRPPGA